MQVIRSRELRERIVPYLLIAPVVLYYTIFWLYPVLDSILTSFRSIGGEFSLVNYRFIFADLVFYQALLNTAFIVVVSVTVEFLVAFGIALLINTKFKGSAIFLFLAIIPMALPAVAVGAIWFSGLATFGPVNTLLYNLGFIAETAKIPFLAGSAFESMILIIIIDAWQVVPFMMIILLAGMQNTKKEMKEAGYIFGGTRLTVLRKITVPLLRPTITTAVILRIISAIQIWLIIVMLFGFQRLPSCLKNWCSSPMSPKARSFSE